MSDSSQKPRRYIGYMATFKYPLNGVQVQQVVDALKGLKLIADVDPIHEPELVDFQAINEDGMPETVPEFEGLPLEEMRIK